MTVKVNVKSVSSHPGSPCGQCHQFGCNGFCVVSKTITSLPNISAASYATACFKCGSYACNGTCIFGTKGLSPNPKQTKCQVCDGYGERKPPEWRSEEKFVECKVCAGKGVI